MLSPAGDERVGADMDTPGNPETMDLMHAWRPLQRWLSSIESERRLDRLERLLVRSTRPLARGHAGRALRGDWLGHALHPMLTDLPIGCWTSSWLLDIVGGRRSRAAAQRLIGLGLLTAIPTMAAGAVDWHNTSGSERRRVGIVHAVSNSLAVVAYVISWRARRHQHYALGVVLGSVAGAAATVGGHLGGHLAFARHTGSGERGTDDIEIAPGDHELDGRIGG